MSREVIIDVKRRVKCDRCGEVQDTHKTILDDPNDSFTGLRGDEKAINFASGVSGW